MSEYGDLLKMSRLLGQELRLKREQEDKKARRWLVIKLIVYSYIGYHLLLVWNWIMAL